MKKSFLLLGIMSIVFVCSIIFMAGNVDVAAAADNDVIMFGVLPLNHPETMFERFNPLMECLEKETGLDFELKLYATKGKTGGYTAAVKGLLSGETPFAYLAPVTICQARYHDHMVEPVVCAQRSGSPTYIGEIAVRNDSDIKTVEDLKGRKVIGSSPSSTSGNLMPSGMLIKKGIKKSEFAAMDFAGGHDKAALAVLAGDYDACWINEKNFKKFKDQGVGLRSIWDHPPVPEFPICVNLRHVKPEIVEKVKKALLKMHETDLTGLKAIDKKYEKWVAMTWESYVPIKKTIDKVHGLKFYELKD